MKDITKSSNKPSPAQTQMPTLGFAKVVAGGRVIRPDNKLPFLERMVMGTQDTQVAPSTREAAILESVASNIEAGIHIIDEQEVGLAKIGGKLADISLALNRCQSPKATPENHQCAQLDVEKAKAGIKQIAQSTHSNTSLFSQGPSKPITVAIPNRGQWEGISIDRPNLETPGLKTVLNGKVHGSGEGYFLDSGSIKKAFDEWRTHCINNRLLWGNLMDRLHGVYRKLSEVKQGATWKAPDSPSDPKLGPLRRPNRNN